MLKDVLDDGQEVPDNVDEGWVQVGSKVIEITKNSCRRC